MEIETDSILIEGIQPRIFSSEQVYLWEYQDTHIIVLSQIHPNHVAKSKTKL